MALQLLLTVLLAVGCQSVLQLPAISSAVVPSRSISIFPDLIPLSKKWTWVPNTAGTIPKGCNFVYGGGYNRLLYVGRVRAGKDVIPASIHHYGPGGSETVRYISHGAVISQRNVEWLCSEGRLAWAQVKDLSVTTLIRFGAVPLGLNSTARSFTYGCLVHSFFSDTYPASLGMVVDGNCVFEVDGQVVNSKDFNFWHTLELLVALL